MKILMRELSYVVLVCFLTALGSGGCSQGSGNFFGIGDREKDGSRDPSSHRDSTQAVEAGNPDSQGNSSHPSKTRKPTFSLLPSQETGVGLNSLVVRVKAVEFKPVILPGVKSEIVHTQLPQVAEVTVLGAPQTGAPSFSIEIPSGKYEQFSLILDETSPGFAWDSKGTKQALTFGDATTAPRLRGQAPRIAGVEPITWNVAEGKELRASLLLQGSGVNQTPEGAVSMPAQFNVKASSVRFVGASDPNDGPGLLELFVDGQPGPIPPANMANLKEAIEKCELMINSISVLDNSVKICHCNFKNEKIYERSKTSGG